MTSFIRHTSLTSALALMLAVSVQVHAQDGNEELLLTLAGQGDTRAALERVGSATDVNIASADGTTPLHWAVYYNDAELVEQLLHRGADVNVRNDYGATPLSQASIEGNADVIAMLLEAGADPDERGANDQTALMIVARTDHVDAARVLLNAGADPNAVESWRGQTALMWASAQQQPAMVKLLLDAGADPNAQSWRTEFERGVTAEPRIKELPDGALTPLLYAAREGCDECVQHLLDAGADPELTDPNEVSPLIMATLNAKWDSAKVLIDNGANVNKWDWWGRTPLYAAVDYNTVPQGGRPDQPSTDVTSSLEIIELLLAKGANPDAQLKLFPPYRALGADRGGDSVLTIGATALHRAARGGDDQALALLLEYGADPNLPTLAEISPLMIAAGYRTSGVDTRGRYRTETQAERVTRMLLEHPDIEVNHRDGTGQTALHGAASQGYSSVVQLLADHGAELSVEDNSGNTALDVAMGRAVSRFGRGGGGTAHPETGALLEKLMAEQ